MVEAEDLKDISVWFQSTAKVVATIAKRCCGFIVG